MGAFLVRHVDLSEGIELANFAMPNILAYEGAEHVYRQIFPAYHAAMTLQMGISGPTPHFPTGRPNYGEEIPFGPSLTWEQCTRGEANEGGGFTESMRISFGYTRKPLSFTASIEADGGSFISQEAVFPNSHSWSPQSGEAWDDPNTTQIEQPPPEWLPDTKGWEPVVGYPWQRPRKLCEGFGDPIYVPAYMEEWEPTGYLNWLCDFRKMGGFPITLVFVGDISRNKLIAAAAFRAPVLLRPGTALHIRYQARIFGLISRDFAYRFARYAFGKTGSRYDALYCRPVLASLVKPTRRTTYADVLPHFHAHFGAVALSSWTYVAGPPPRVESSNVPQWTNTSGAAIGPFGCLAVYGSVGGGNELMWLTPIDPPVSVPNGDTLRVPDKVRFRLEGV